MTVLIKIPSFHRCIQEQEIQETEAYTLKACMTVLVKGKNGS